MKHFWSLALLFTAFTFLKSKGQEISGRITDKLTNETLIGVNILLDGKGIASSDFDGKFRISANEGNHEMVFKFIGYEEEKINFTMSAGESKQIEIKMIEDAELIETVVISAGKFEQRIEETTVSIEVIKPNLISNKNTYKSDSNYN